MAQTVDELHWSVDYSYQTAERDFRGEFSRTLANALAAEPIGLDADKKSHRYRLLPNFHSGFKREAPAEVPTLSIGDVSVERTRREGVWEYHVEHANTTSGEELTLDFSCDDSHGRPLRSPWRIRSRNDADGSYSSISLAGTVEPMDASRKVELATEGGLTVSAGTVPHASTLTCNWALLDIIPALDGGRLEGLAILDDLEMLKVDCKIQPLEDWTFEVGPDRHRLTGYTVLGTGLPPSYWWLTEAGEVAVAATMLSTYVLEGRET